jgi:hypothetical protein
MGYRPVLAYIVIRDVLSSQNILGYRPGHALVSTIGTYTYPNKITVSNAP